MFLKYLGCQIWSNSLYIYFFHLGYSSTLLSCLSVFIFAVACLKKTITQCIVFGQYDLSMTVVWSCYYV